MANGEINGTNVLLFKGDNASGTVLVGQGDLSIAFAGNPIDISNKTYDDYVTLMNGQLANKQVTLSGTLVYNSDTTYHTVKADALNGTIDQYTVKWPDGKYLTANFQPSQPTDTAPQGDKVTTAITFLSSGGFSPPST